jgi:hypothetical protein
MAETNCKLELAADLPVSWVAGDPVVTVKIVGQPVRMVLDTGSDSSYLSEDIYNRLNLHNLVTTTGMYVDILGGTEQISAATMQDITFGAVTMHGQVLALLSRLAPGPNGKPLVDGIMGYDMLSSFDIAFDMGHNNVQLFSLEHCDTAQFPWTGQYAQVTLEHRGGLAPALTVQVDGQPVQIELDSGAGQSLVSGPALIAAGVKPEAVAKASQGSDMAGHGFNLTNEQFSTYTVGAEEFSDMWLQVDQTPQKNPDVPLTGLLGEDYLTTHKVFVSNSTETLLLGISEQ